MKFASRYIYMFVLVFSTSCLAFALFSEYILGMVACKLCMYQRIPHVLLMLLSITGFAMKDKWYRILVTSIIVVFVFEILLISYHVGVEHGFVTFNCQSDFDFNKFTSLDNLTKAIENNHNIDTDCSIVQSKFLFLSMSEWHLIGNIFALAVIFYLI